MKVQILSVGFASMLLMGVPAFAMAASAANQAVANANQNSGQSDTRQDAVNLVKDATGALKQAKNDQKFDKLLHKAKGVFIVPHYGKGALIVGGAGGHGVLLAREDGHWSDPAFLGVGSISAGAQAGGEAGPIIMVLMTDKALNEFTAHNNFSLNANAGLSIVNYSARGEAGFGKGDVVMWSNTSGAYAGAAITGSNISADQNRDNAFYNQQNLTTNKIIKQNVTNAAAAPLVGALAS